MSEKTVNLKHVRRNCLACSGGSAKYVTWCTCDGVHSTKCEFWPFRFGIQPATFQARYGDRLLDPRKMPPADLDLDLLPGVLQEAATGAIAVDGYQQPAVQITRRHVGRRLTPEQREAAAERFRAMRRGKATEMAPG